MYKAILAALMLALLSGCISICNGQVYYPQFVSVEKTCEICSRKYYEYKRDTHIIMQDTSTLPPEDVTYMGIDNISFCDYCREKYKHDYFVHKSTIDEKYQLELRAFKDKFIKSCKVKEKATIAELERSRKEMRLKEMINNKEIENAQKNLDKLIKEKEAMEKEGIKPAPDYYINIGGVILSSESINSSTAALHNQIKK